MWQYKIRYLSSISNIRSQLLYASFKLKGMGSMLTRSVDFFVEKGQAEEVKSRHRFEYDIYQPFQAHYI